MHKCVCVCVNVGVCECVVSVSVKCPKCPALSPCVLGAIELFCIISLHIM